MRRGIGKGLGMGYKNLVPMDSHIHSLSAKGVKSARSLNARTVTEKFKVYKFDELSKEMKEKVLEKYRDINVDYDGWWDFVYEDHQQTLAESGFNNPKMSFSGFWSQGDGASFSADVDVAKWLKKNKLANKYRKVLNAYEKGDFSLDITKSGRYEHSGTMDYKSYNMMDDYEQGEEVAEMILKDARQKADKLYKDLEENYEDMTSDEQVAETLKANDYEFRDGKIY